MRRIIDPANRQKQTIKEFVLVVAHPVAPRPTTRTLNPMTRNPFGYSTRRETIMTGGPVILMTCPMPVASDPNISGSRWRRGRFDNHSRRTDAHIDSGVRFRRNEKEAEDNHRP